MFLNISLLSISINKQKKMDKISNHKSIRGFTPIRLEVVWEYDTLKEGEILIYRERLKKDRMIEKIYKDGVPYHKAIVEKNSLRLNKTASIVWELCDGVTTVDEIIYRVSNKYPQICKAEIEKDIISLLRLLHKSKLVKMNWKLW